MANIILKNRNGEPVLHENRTSIKLPKQGGGEAIFYENGSSGKDHTFDIPQVEGTYTYSEAAQSPVLSGYYSDFMELSGNTSATNAGTYAITITLKDTENCQWRDGTTEAKTINWSIAKANLPTPTLNPAELILSSDEQSTSKTFSVIRNGNGEVIATPSDPSKIAVSVSGSAVTVTAIDTSTEVTVSVMITIGEDINYNAYTGSDSICNIIISDTISQIKITTNTANVRFPLFVTVSALGQFSVDWGDGTSTTPTSYNYPNFKSLRLAHTYESPGTYYIIIHAPSGITWSPGGRESQYGYCQASGHGSTSPDGWGTGVNRTMEIVLGSSVTTLQKYAFHWDSLWLTHLKFKNVRTIEDHSIGNITRYQVAFIEFNKELTTMGDYLFSVYTDSALVITCHATTPPVLGTHAFSTQDMGSSYGPATCYVPSESVEDYKIAQGWSHVSTTIYPIPT